MHSGFPLSAQERGDQLLFTFLAPFIWELDPKLMGQVLFHLIFLSDYLHVAFLWCSYCWAIEHGQLWTQRSAHRLHLFDSICTRGEDGGACLGFGSPLYFFSSLCPISSELYSTITCCHCIRLPIIIGDRGAPWGFNTSSLTLYISLGATWEKITCCLRGGLALSVQVTRGGRGGLGAKAGRNPCLFLGSCIWLGVW